MKKLAIMQPYFFPYIGYFQLINAVDTFVLYDDVTYIKGGWIARNRIYEPNYENEWNYWGLPLKESSSNKLIKDIKYIRDWQRLLKTVQQNYGKTPYSDEVWNSILLDIAGNQMATTIAELNYYAIFKICKYLGIKTPIIRSSDVYFDNVTIGRAERLIDICKRQKAEVYINAQGGKALYSKEYFRQYGIDLYFLKTNEIKYTQKSKNFLPNLSILDVLMYNSKDEIKSFLNNYILE